MAVYKNIVVVGSGVGGVTFAEKYRALAPEAKITLVTKEQDGYYSRPLLSRGFTKENIEQSIILKSFEQLPTANIDLLAGASVVNIDRSRKSVLVENAGSSQAIPYDVLVLALGSAAFIPPPFAPYQDMFFCLNSLADLKALRRYRQSFIDHGQNPHWAVVGGGLIGCEVASDLAVAGDKVTVYHAMDRLMERQLAAEDSAKLLGVLQASGVEVLLNQNVKSFAKAGAKMAVVTDVERQFDGVIVATGFKPRIDLAVQAGLATGRGIKVNNFLQTNDDSVYVLGDAAEFPDGKTYAYILPIRNQALWLAGYLAGQNQAPWTPPAFTTKAKVHNFEADQPYNI